MFNKLVAFISQDFTHLFVSLFALILLLSFIVLLMAYLDAFRRRDRFRKATPASAKIVKIGRPYGNGTFGSEILNITLDVIPTDAAPYRVKNVWCFEPVALAKVKEGDALSVRINAKDLNVIFSAETFAWNVSQIPPRYGDRVVVAYLRK